MNNNNFFNTTFNRSLTVTQSYHENFTQLNDAEITGLCSHDSLLKKVHEEMKLCDNEFDINTFDRNLQVFQNSGKDFKSLSVYKCF